MIMILTTWIYSPLGFVADEHLCRLKGRMDVHSWSDWLVVLQSKRKDSTVVARKFF
jgi:hypothetical protein